MGDHAEPEPHVVVVFGATGDLARRSLFPALFRLHLEGAAPPWRIVGSGLDPQDTGAFREHVAGAVREFAADAADDDAVARFVADVDFAAARDDDLDALAAAVRGAERDLGTGARRLVYLSVPPSAVPAMVSGLGAADLAERTRLVVEKPFGHDLDSAREMFAAIGEVFAERDVYLIDHFLGVAALQDLLAERAADPEREAAWNRHGVESVRIDVLEEIDLQGRGAFLESTGTFRDMVSSHLLQVLAWIAMDLPEQPDENGLRAARSGVLAALRPLDPAETVFGQYRGYRDTDGVDPDSTVETFVAARAWVDSDRWSGVPFLLRTGKAMAAAPWAATVRLRDPGTDVDPDVVVDLDAADAYRRLLHAALRGDRTLFVGAAEAERLWEVCAPVLDHPPAAAPYDRGSWGPQAAVDLVDPDRR